MIPSLIVWRNTMLVFLDLEETVLDNWDDANMLMGNVRWLQKRLALVNCTLGLMSWAVWDEKDKTKFNSEMRPMLEEALGMPFDNRFVWSMDEWAEQVFKHHGKKVSRQDLFDLMGKQEVLFVLSRCHPDFKDNNLLLVDDAVEHDLSCLSVKNNCTVTMKNVNDWMNE
jgi:hypothetical protein